MIFLDASVLLAAEDVDDREHQASLALLRTGDLATLDLALYETTNVATVRWKDADAAARLAASHGLSAYDAGYVAGARRLGAPLASCDERDLVGTGLAKLPSALVSV